MFPSAVYRAVGAGALVTAAVDVAAASGTPTSNDAGEEVALRARNNEPK